MSAAGQPRGLAQLSTFASRRLAAMPSRRDGVHHQLFRLEAERRRLEAELRLLLERGERVSARLDETTRRMEALVAGLDGTPAPASPARGGWRRMTVGY